MIPLAELTICALTFIASGLAGLVAGFAIGVRHARKAAILDADVKLAEAEWLDAQRREVEEL